MNTYTLYRREGLHYKIKHIEYFNPKKKFLSQHSIYDTRHQLFLLKLSATTRRL